MNKNKKVLRLQEIAMRADAPVLFNATVEPIVLSAFARNDGQYRRYVRIGTVPNFKPKRAKRLFMNERLDRLGEYEEYKDVRWAKVGAEWAAHKYGKLIGVSYETITNDDTDEVVQVSDEFGRIAGLTRAEFIPKFLDRLPISRDLEGAQLRGPLTPDLIERALQAWGSQRDHGGEEVNLTLGRVVHHGTTLGRSLRTIIRPSTDGDYNAYAGALPDDGLVDEPRIKNKMSIYMLTDPAAYAPLEMDFLVNPADARENYSERPRVIAEPGTPVGTWLPGDAGMGSEGFRFDTLASKVRDNFGGGWREEALPPERFAGEEGHRLGIMRIEVEAA